MADRATPGAVPPPVETFLAQDPAASVLGPATRPGPSAQVAVVATDVASLRDLDCPPGVLTRVVGIFLHEGAAAPVSDVEKTSLGAYTKFFKKSFIKPLFARLRTARRGESEKAAVETGDW